MSLEANDNDALVPIAAKLSELADLYEEIAGLTKKVEAHGRKTLAALEAAPGPETTSGSLPPVEPS